MEKFAYESGNKRVSEVLFDALRRRHPYRCFKDKINDLGISQIYYDYRNRTYINIAEEWCRNHHVPYRRKRRLGAVLKIGLIVQTIRRNRVNYKL
ncbi:MAG: hypothetical protein ACLSBD_12930 [Blautia massiliensis (ex Durand et al. 2017)]